MGHFSVSAQCIFAEHCSYSRINISIAKKVPLQVERRLLYILMSQILQSTMPCLRNSYEQEARNFLSQLRKPSKYYSYVLRKC